MYRKAVKTGCDIVCLELEDGIALQDKTSARDKVIEFLGRNTNEDNSPEQVIRVNPINTAEGMKDLLAFAELQTSPNQHHVS